ncbi:EF-hand domain-containing protein [Haloferula sp.]|uniref:EF-hand domain-containing protein n=1 Tax=Haloferula sp. TaxID=2497595 RepID=UPI0032A005BB
MKSLILLLPVALLASCASTTTPSPEKRFKQADKDGDSLVSRQEATDIIIGDAFDMFDANGDGLIDEAEYVASGGDVAVFRKNNKPGSAGITLEEAKANPLVVDRFAVSFDEADVSGNGAVTYEEYLDYIKRLEAAVR